MRTIAEWSRPSSRHETEQFGYKKHHPRWAWALFVKSLRAECSVTAKQMEYQPAPTLVWLKMATEISGLGETHTWCAGRPIRKECITRLRSKRTQGKSA